MIISLDEYKASKMSKKDQLKYWLDNLSLNDIIVYNHGDGKFTFFINNNEKIVFILPRYNGIFNAIDLSIQIAKSNPASITFIIDTYEDLELFLAMKKVFGNRIDSTTDVSLLQDLLKYDNMNKRSDSDEV